MTQIEKLEREIKLLRRILSKVITPYTFYSLFEAEETKLKKEEASQ